jgi:hypothetical protein
MSQPPPHVAVPSTDFGPPTVSGTPVADRKDAAQDASPGSGAGQGADSGQRRVARPLVTGRAAPTQTTTQVPPVNAPNAPNTPTAQPGPQPGPHGAPQPGFQPVPGVPSPAGALGGPGASGAPSPGPSVRAARGPRRAKLQLRHINPWTVLKFSCVLSIALFFVWLIVVGVLYGVLDASGAIGKINDTVTTINGAGSKRPVTAGIVFGGAAIVGVVNVVLFIALSTIGSVIYNLCADLVGGVEVTLSER